MMENTFEFQLPPAPVRRFYYAYADDGRYLSTMQLEPEDVRYQTNLTQVVPEFVEGFLPWFIDGKWVNKELDLLPPSVNMEVVQPEAAPSNGRVYPPIGEQLDMLWHAMDNGELPKAGEFYETIKAIKEGSQ